MRRPRPAPAAKPPKLDGLEAAAQALRLETELGEMAWRRRASDGLPEGWREVAKAHPTRPRKTKVTLLLDEDVAAFYRWQGEGYQARINAILRLYMVAKIGKLA